MTDDSRLAVRGPLGTYSDAAHRAADIINTHLMADPAGNVGRWVAIRLSDGGSDSTTYATRPDAIRHQLHESQCTYVIIPPTGATAKSMEVVIKYARMVYDAGHRMPDPDSWAPTMPNSIEKLRRMGLRLR